VKFTPPAGFVRVSIGRIVNQVCVRVTDSGCGISSDFLPHVFDRFRQAEGSSARIQPGLGLGLTLVRELIELHGGTVQAESAGKDRGATFTVVLPIPAVLLEAEPEPPLSTAKLKPATIPPTTPAELPSAPLRHLLDGTRVLVVDDEMDAREALVGLLERCGAQVRSAASVAEAMTALASEVPDVLISDIGMPREDGYELIRRVRLLPAEAGGNVPSLAVSAYATDEHRRKVLKTGYQRHLEKPVAPTELVNEVVRLAARSHESGPD
ncbi:MAG TPA: response regulator, partial [Polyangiaceae bacterium]|nr:response regulator [Polyangiaceae bacterium]